MLQTLGPALANAVIAALVFFYLWLRDRRLFLAVWALAWSLWVVRYAYGLGSQSVALVPASAVLPTLAVLRGGLILWGTYLMLRSELPRGWLVVLGADLALIAIELASGRPLPLPGPAGLVHYALFAATLVWSGLLFSRGGDLPRLEARVTGYALVVFGVAQVTFPLLTSLPKSYMRSVYVVVYALQALVPIGILMAYVRRSADEVWALHTALSEALTRALSEHIPICAHCKAIREDEAWVGLEAYVSERTEATFSHGICPTCLERHYPDLVSPEGAPA